MERPSHIRSQLIVRHMAEIEGYGSITRVGYNPDTGRPGTAYYLNEEQALLVVMFSRTEKAAELRREIISVFQAWRHGELQAPAQPALPDFSNPALAARAWADAFEAKLQAEAEREQEAAGRALADGVTPAKENPPQIFLPSPDRSWPTASPLSPASKLPHHGLGLAGSMIAPRRGGRGRAGRAGR